MAGKLTNDHSSSSSAAGQKSSSSLTSKQPTTKKYVSMTRLDQLAQPKKRTIPPASTASNVPPSSLTSSNATSTTTSSLTSNKNYSYSTTNRSVSNQPRRQSGNSLRAKPDATNNNSSTTATRSKDTAKTRYSLGRDGTANRSQQQASKVSTKQITNEHQKQKQQRQQSSPEHSLKESTPLKLTETFDAGINSISPIKSVNQSIEQDTSSSPAAALTESYDAVPASVSGTAEQLSEMSVTDRHWESAASELVQDSESSITNGINYDCNPDSLRRELEQELIATGMVKDEANDNYDTPKTYSNNLSARRESIATVLASDQLTPKLSRTEDELRIRIKSEEKRLREEEEEERRRRDEEAVRERIRLEEEERRNREQLVEKILSKFSPSS